MLVPSGPPCVVLAPGGGWFGGGAALVPKGLPTGLTALANFTAAFGGTC